MPEPKAPQKYKTNNFNTHKNNLRKLKNPRKLHSIPIKQFKPQNPIFIEPKVTNTHRNQWNINQPSSAQSLQGTVTAAGIDAKARFGRLGGRRRVGSEATVGMRGRGERWRSLEGQSNQASHALVRPLRLLLARGFES